MVVRSEITEKLKAPSDVAVNDSGDCLPAALLGLWASLGIGYQELFPLNDVNSTSKFIYWWLSMGCVAHPGLKEEINHSLVTSFHTHKGKDVEAGEITELQSLIYANRDDFRREGGPLKASDYESGLEEWWYTFGCSEYDIPYWGIPLDVVVSLSKDVDDVVDLGYGQAFSSVLRFLYRNIGHWRLRFDLASQSGARSLVLYFISTVLKETDDVSVLFTEATIRQLSVITCFFSDFNSVEFKRFCYRLWIGSSDGELKELDDWWRGEGEQCFDVFILCLGRFKDTSRLLSSYKLATPAGGVVNSGGDKLPETLLLVWSSLDKNYRKLFPVDDIAASSAFVHWWLLVGQGNYPGVQREINLHLVSAFSGCEYRGIDKTKLPALLEIVYENRTDLIDAYSDLNSISRCSEIWEWWYAYGATEYNVPYFGIPLGVLKDLSMSCEFLLGEGCGIEFSGVLRFLYQNNGFWRARFDLQCEAGMRSFFQFVLSELIKPGCDVSIFFSASMQRKLLHMTSNLNDFGSDEFRGFCFALFAEDVDLPLQQWWSDRGAVQCEVLIDCLKNCSFVSVQEDVHAKSGIALVGYPQGAFGIGEDVRLVSRSLAVASYECEVYRSLRSVIAASEEFDGYKSVAEYNGEPIKIFCMPAFDLLGLMVDGGLGLFDGGYNIGLWQWELENFPVEANLAFELVDEIWTISNHAASSIRKSTSKPVHVIPLPVSVGEVASVSLAGYGVPDSAFVFYFAFDGASFIARKNPLAVVEAFQRAFDKTVVNVRLIIKGMNIQPSDIWGECQYRASTDSRIIIIDERLSKKTLYELVNAVDCIVSLHRAEGFGRVMAEGLLLGKPVVASRYSGCLDYLSDQTAYLVDGQLTPVKPGDYSFAEGNQWFQPDLDSAAMNMQAVYSDRAERDAKAQRGKLIIENNYSEAATALFIEKRMEQICG